MSRTLNTRPYKARKEIYVAHHDHRNGECDLPPLDEFMKGVRTRPRGHWIFRTECTWWPDYHKVRDTRCSCPLCRDPWWAAFKKKQKAGPMPTLDDY